MERRVMEDSELIEQTRAAFDKRNIAYGDFWEIVRSPASFTVVSFWGVPPGNHNPAAQFDEERGEFLWCHGRVLT